MLFPFASGVLMLRCSLVGRQGSDVLDLNVAARQLAVEKRRIYDITNVLEGVNLVSKVSNNQIRWRGASVWAPSPQEPAIIEALHRDVRILCRQEAALDRKLREVADEVRAFSERPELNSLAYVTHDDMRNLESLKGQTVIAIRAPAGTRLEVPDPDDGMEPGKRRFQLFLKTDKKQPIDVFLVNSESDFTPYGSSSPGGLLPLHYLQQQQQQQQQPSLPEPTTPPRGPLSPGVHTILPLGHTVGGLDADYYLSGMYADEGISDFFNDDPPGGPAELSWASGFDFGDWSL